MNGAPLTKNKNKDKTTHWELLWTLDVFPLKKTTWTARTGPLNQLPETVTCGSYPDSNFIRREFSRTTCNPVPQHSHLAYLTGLDQEIFQKWNFYIPHRDTKHRANGMIQILPGTYNEDIKLDLPFIGYFIFYWGGGGERKHRSQPTYLFGLQMNFWVYVTAFSPT